ncbi:MULTISPECIES: ferredoxin [unclassified Mycobacterium]|uniref:ferredoxin n=1 Tax=unclassified Mycobacterium TaxID=2642494 RepID=UPI0029C8CCE1|nr:MULTISPECIES: ferredoxin [unclassified Mycobacterium]
MTVRIDTSLCEGHGLCLELAPSVFDINDEDIAVCDPHPNGSLLLDVRAAVAACPRQAIHASTEGADHLEGDAQ